MEIAAVVLAAGKGKRMGSENGSEIPKVMFKANGKPVVSYLIQSLCDAGLKKIVLVVGYKQEIVRDYFKDQVEYAVQEEQLGTGHATMSARVNLEGKSDAVIVCCGDAPLFKPETIKNLIDLYTNEKPTIAMLTVEYSDPTGYGRIIRNTEGNVDAIIEHKDCDEEQLKTTECNPAFYVFDSLWLWKNLANIKTNNTQGEYYLTDVIKMAKDQGKKISAVKIADETEVLGINTPEQLQQVENVLTSRIKN
ncbi:MAG: NTP transferase domain-containing protein [Patescibacteria group bacterium]|jgi:bifunctional UDP-N-acetylglucosamine pyrophosphorylase/glucosamine-1-phosphate N-acetyltransferase